MKFYLVLFFSFIFSINTYNLSDSTNTALLKDSIKHNIIKNELANWADSLDASEQGDFEIVLENDIFYAQLLESKLTFADAIMYDTILDTIEAAIQFQYFIFSIQITPVEILLPRRPASDKG